MRQIDQIQIAACAQFVFVFAFVFLLDLCYGRPHYASTLLLVHQFLSATSYHKDIIKKHRETDPNRQNNPLSTSLNIHLRMAVQTFRYMSFSTKSMQVENHLTVGLCVVLLCFVLYCVPTQAKQRPVSIPNMYGSDVLVRSRTIYQALKYIFILKKSDQVRKC